jgi:hypothetical protein
MKQDLFGRTIAVGDFFAYPVRTGSRTYTSVIVVTRIGKDTITGSLVRVSGGYTGSTPQAATGTVTVFATERGIVLATTMIVQASLAEERRILLAQLAESEHEVAAYLAILRDYNTLASTFIEKCETGRAHSVETLASFRDLRERAYKLGVFDGDKPETVTEPEVAGTSGGGQSADQNAGQAQA